MCMLSQARQYVCCVYGCACMHVCICLCMGVCIVCPFDRICSVMLGADIELGASSPLMEAAQEGHVDIVKFLIEKG